MHSRRIWIAMQLIEFTLISTDKRACIDWAGHPRVVGYTQAIANLAHSSLRVSQSAFPRAAFLDLRWNRPEGANRMIKFLRHALKSRAHLDSPNQGRV